MEREYKDKEDQLKKMSARPMTAGEVAASLLEETGISQTEFARRVGVSRATINELFNNRRALTPDMAHRLGRFFGNGAGTWLRLQANVEMWDALHMDQTPYQSIEPLKIAA